MTEVMFAPVDIVWAILMITALVVVVSSWFRK